MKNIHSILLAGLLSLMLGSCRTIAPSYDYRELARASLRMGMDIDMKDNHALYVVSSQWLGVPYRLFLLIPGNALNPHHQLKLFYLQAYHPILTSTVCHLSLDA